MRTKYTDVKHRLRKYNIPYSTLSPAKLRVVARGNTHFSENPSAVAAWLDRNEKHLYAPSPSWFLFRHQRSFNIGQELDHGNLIVLFCGMEILTNYLKFAYFHYQAWSHEGRPNNCSYTDHVLLFFKVNGTVSFCVFLDWICFLLTGLMFSCGCYSYSQKYCL